MIELSDEEVLGRLVKGDRYFGHRCYECTLHGAMFIVRGRMVSVCPRCVQGRIAALEAELGGLPADIAVFRDEAVREVAYQERKEKEALSVTWNDLYKCHRCGHLVQEFEVRYPETEPGGNVRHPYCYACYLVWRAGKGSHSC